MYMNNFYDDAINTAEMIKEQYPGYAENPNAVACVILSNEDNIFAGVNGIAVHGDTVVGAYAELAAAAAMKTASKARAVKMATVSLMDLSILTPEQAVVSALFDMNSLMSNCEILISPQESVVASELTGGNEFFAGFDDMFADVGNSDGFDEGTSSSPFSGSGQANYSNGRSASDFSDGVEIDVTNPFYDASSANEQNSDVKFFAEMPSEGIPNAAAGGQGAVNTFSATAGIDNSQPEISKEDLLKQAKQRKKIAKAKFGFKK